MRLRQLLLRDHEAGQEPEARKHRVQDPHPAQALRERVPGDLPLRWGQGVDEPHVCLSVCAAETASEVLAKGGGEASVVAVHFVLEDDAADDDGGCGGELADEAEGGRGGGDVAWFRVGLERDEGSLEDGPGSEAADDLVEDYFRPGGVRIQVDVEAVTKSEEEHAGPDRGKVLSCLADEDTCEDGEEGE